jgi:IS5 family transposase
MRKRFEGKRSLGCTPVHELKVPPTARGHMVAFVAAFQYIYVNPKWKEKVFSLLAGKISKKKRATGHNGMSLLEIFVLGQVRFCMNIGYDELHYGANYENLLRGLLGVLPTDFTQGKDYQYQNIYDNVRLLDNELLKQDNDVIVSVGHEVFKKRIGCFALKDR